MKILTDLLYFNIMKQAQIHGVSAVKVFYQLKDLPPKFYLEFVDPNESKHYKVDREIETLLKSDEDEEIFASLKSGGTSSSYSLMTLNEQVRLGYMSKKEADEIRYQSVDLSNFIGKSLTKGTDTAVEKVNAAVGNNNNNFNNAYSSSSNASLTYTVPAVVSCASSMRSAEGLTHVERLRRESSHNANIIL